MKRIHLLLAALAIVVTSFAAFSGPAMADDWDHDWDNNENVVWHDNDGDWGDDWDNDWDDDWNHNGSWNNGWNNSWWWNNGWNNNGCEGPVCLID